ncbi:MAG: GNAT family N-acetyltransferase [Clostridia bacterium]|nr:GNAT family N-acetyltransferase [Clostridia bacterium]
MIKKLGIEMMPQVSRLIWKSFYSAEKDSFSLEGMEYFRNMTEPPVLQLEILRGATGFWGAYKNGLLAGVLATKKDRVVLLFVGEDFQRRGIGAELIKFAAKKCSGEYLTLDSTPSAVGFYEKLGFVRTEPEKLEGGIRSLPMRAEREVLLKKLTK